MKIFNTCIGRYSCRFYGSQSDALWCASGTVFNDILLWPLAGREMNATVAARLQGHEVLTVAYITFFTFSNKHRC